VDAGVLLQAVLTGLALGAVYGLVGLGVTLVHRLTGVLNLAHGDLVVGALFVSVAAVVGTTPVVSSPAPVTGLAQVGVALAAGVVLSVLMYAVAVGPFTASGLLAVPPPAAALGWVGATLAVGLLLRESLGLLFERDSYALADPLRLDRLTTDGVLRLPGGGLLPVRVVGVLVIGLLVGLAAERFVATTRTGRAMRAVADDPATAALMGVPARRLVLLAFVLAGALAGLAGVLVGPGGRAGLAGGVVLGLKGTAAAVLGRLGSPLGALVAGLGLGVLESVAVASDALGPAYADVLPLSVLVVAVVLRAPVGESRT
jgi:branched-chain amino acid transport system permease protein